MKLSLLKDNSFKYKIIPFLCAFIVIISVACILLNSSKSELSNIDYSVALKDFNSLNKVNEFSYLANDYYEHYYSYAETFKYNDGYVYTKREKVDDIFNTYIIHSDKNGNEVWSYKYESDKDVRWHNLILLDDKVYVAANDYGLIVLDINTGDLIIHDYAFKVYDIELLGDNLVVLKDDGVYIINSDLEVLYSIENNLLATNDYNVLFNDFYIDESNVYLLATKSLISETKYTPIIYTLDLELNYVNELNVTYDENQGYLSENGYYYRYSNFIKDGENFYQIGNDVHKIDSDGTDTLLVDYFEFENRVNNSVIDILIFDDFYVTLEAEYVYYEDEESEYYDHSNGYLSIRNKDFDLLKQYLVNDSFIQYGTVPENMTFVDDKIIVKWYDWATYESYVSEFEFSTESDMCTVVSGTGYDIGDEIKCGSEEFYVIENDGVNVKMMSKYNLLVGGTYEKVIFDETVVTSTYNEMNDYIYNNDIIRQKLLDGYYVDDVFYTLDSTTSEYTLTGVSLYDSYQNDSFVIFCEKDSCTKDDFLLMDEVQNYLTSDYNSYSFMTDSADNYLGIRIYQNEWNDYKYVFLDEAVTNIEDLLLDSKVQEKLNEGYNYSTITLTDDSYIGVELYSEGSYEYVFTDEHYASLKEFLANPEILSYLDSGYRYSTIKDSEENYFGVRLWKNNENLKYVFLEEGKSSRLELIRTEEVQELLNSEYYYSSYVSESGSYFGAELLKNQDETYKSIIFDTTYLTYKSFYEREDVQSLVADGYVLKTSYTDYPWTRFCSSTSGFCTKYLYGAAFYKSTQYDFVTIFFDDYLLTDDRDIYIENNEEIQNKLADGYSIYSYLSDYYKTYDSTTSSNSYDYHYFGIVLRKQVGSGSTNSTPYIMEKLVPYEVRQDESAVGAHGDEEGKPEPVEVGLVEPYDVWGYYSSKIYSGGYQDYQYYTDDLTHEYYHSYYSTLRNDGFNVLDVNSISVSELNELVYKITGSEIPLEEWHNTALEVGADYVTENGFYIMGSIKDLMPEEYSWLWSTTYWTRTKNYYDPDAVTLADARGMSYATTYIYFIDTLGDLCKSDYCQGAVGAGLRPVVTMSLSSIDFNVITESDGNGIVSASHSDASTGEEITFTITPNDGYVLSKLSVIDSLGNTIEYTEDYAFTMPAADVTISATFVKKEYFEPQIEIQAVKPTNNRVGERTEFILTITNPNSYPISDVEVSTNSTILACINDCTKVDDSSFIIGSIEANSSVSYSIYYYVDAIGTINATAEITNAIADIPYFFNEDKEYVATASATTTAGVKICNVLSGTSNSSVNQYNITSYNSGVKTFDYWITLEDNECTSIALETGVSYTISQLDRQEYTLISIDGGLLSSNGHTVYLEPKEYSITFYNEYNKKGYFHTWDRVENDVNISDFIEEEPTDPF